MGAIISIAVGLLAILAVVAVVGLAMWVFVHVFGIDFARKRGPGSRGFYGQAV